MPKGNAAKKAVAPSANKNVTVVGIGASAGGLEALKRMLEQLPPAPGVAIVIQQHLEPKHPSHMAELLDRICALPVQEASDNVLVEVDHVYVAPSEQDMELRDGYLRMIPRSPKDGLVSTIDRFFSSLAGDAGPRSMGVILSGTGSDGTLGLGKIKAAGGITFAQDPATAGFASMPESAQRAGTVDMVLAPSQIADEIVKLAAHPYTRMSLDLEGTTEPSDEGMPGVFKALLKVTGVDFANHKQATFRRRVQRRMALLGLASLPEYVSRLNADPHEVHALFSDALINVTAFFRDPESYDALRKHVLPKILEHQSPERTIRIWVAGCATGEEVYSIAITLLEFLGDIAPGQMQIFGTDLNESNIQAARSGLFKGGIEDQVPEDLLARYFVRNADGGYRISKRVRDLCIFSVHNLYRDPPFSGIDLISCRNVLIYLNAAAQHSVLASFHYALKPHGFLTLGPSETPGVLERSFRAVDRKNRIYMRKNVATPLARPLFQAPNYTPTTPRKHTLEINDATDTYLVERVLVDHFVPAGVVVDREGEVLRFLGRTGEFLEHTPGRANMNLFRMAHHGLEVDLRSALRHAQTHRTPTFQHDIRWITDSGVRIVDLDVLPVTGTQDEQYVITFRSRPESNNLVQAPASMDDATRDAAGLLEAELDRTRKQLQEISEQYEATTEELRTSNEETLSMNEELQSTNEEMQTTAEELQSANEELTTLNEELQNRNEQLNRVNDDVINLLASVRLPIIFLGPDLRIRRFTPTARRALNFIDSDVGRSITDLRPKIPLGGLMEKVRDVMEHLTVQESEVQDEDGHWYRLHIQPYRTAENRIDGAVLVLMDIDDIKRASEELRCSNRDLENFASFASHELQEPLRNMRQFMQLATAPDASIASRDSDIESVFESLDRATRLVKTLLRFARLGSQTAELRRVSLSQIVEGARQNLSKFVQENEALVEIKGALPEAMADESLLGDLFSNLFLNAIQNQAEATPHIQVEVVGGGDELMEIVVRDNGIGVPPDQYEQIFELFRRGTTSRGDGLGMGLALCRRIVDMHGGNIWAESHLEQGMEFHFTLPKVTGASLAKGLVPQSRQKRDGGRTP